MVVGDKLWLLAGWDPGFKQDGGDILSDVWVLDLVTSKWDQVTVQASFSCSDDVLPHRRPQPVLIRSMPQGATMPAVSRFQAVAVGSRIFIHTHRSTESILVLDTGKQPPELSEQRYTSRDAPSSR